jgi:plasmid stability protein
VQGPSRAAADFCFQSTELGMRNQPCAAIDLLSWRSASAVLAFCDMRTLYLRNVPDDVVARLERLAARDATSVGAVAVRELAEVSRRADNPALLGSLPDFGVDAATILHDLDAGRADR